MKKISLLLIFLFLTSSLAIAGMLSPKKVFINITDNTNINEWARKQIVYSHPAASKTIEILYPYHESIFPPEFPSPEIIWKDDNPQNTLWLIHLNLSATNSFTVACATTTWTPSAEIWEACKLGSKNKFMNIQIQGFSASETKSSSSWDTISIMTSNDPVGAPIFFRDVSLPFFKTVKNMSDIKWRLGDVSKTTAPRVVLKKMPVCGNCHSFSQDGKTFGMDADFASDKGGYFIASVSEEIILNKDKVISWSNFSPNNDTSSFGLLARVSPDGKKVIASVEDAAVFVTIDDLAFSILFFPSKGILGVYDVAKKTFSALPGADDPKYVQSSAAWSPDGKTILFCKTLVNTQVMLKYKSGLKTDTPTSEVNKDMEGTSFKFDICQIPFNDGKGGKAIPLTGASENGKSNYFPKYSPDGKWIVFTQSANYMLLQPDSKLYIIPASGGKPRLMNCNRKLMNSWHSFSPNSRWLVFSSKTNTPYTQLFLAHIDENGNDAPPVLLKHFTESDRAANIPEFANIKFDDLQKITEAYVDEFTYLNQAMNYFHKTKELDKAEKAIRKHLEMKPNYCIGWTLLGQIAVDQGKEKDAVAHFEKAISLNIFDPHPVEYLEILQEKLGNKNASNELLFTLCQIYINDREYDKAKTAILKVIARSDDKARGYILLSKMHAQAGDLKEAEDCANTAIKLSPDNPALHDYLKKLLTNYGKK